jgi:autotransporter-associated beta strand protein
VIGGGTVSAASINVSSGNSGGNLTISNGSLTIGTASTTGGFQVGTGTSTTRGGFLSVFGGALNYAGTDGLLVNNGASTAGTAAFNGGVSTLTGITLNQAGNTAGSASLTIGGSAAVYLGSVGLQENSGAATATINLSGGILGAAANWSSSAPMTLGGAQIQAADASGVAHNITLNGALGGSTLSKTGNGTLTLGGVNNYSGTTSVTNGALIVNGSIGSGAVTVTNATLGGVGTIGGATTLQANSILAAGNGGIGTLTFSGNLMLNAASTNNFVVTTVGGASNKVAVVGTLTPGSSVISVTSGTPLHPGTNTLFTYGTVSGTFDPALVFDFAPVHPAVLVDDAAGHINLVVPNAPPVANTNTYTRNGLANWKIAVSDLLTNASDPDNDSLTLTNVSTSTNGVTLVISGGYVQYSNTNLVDDQFTYTVSDPYGATASGVITLTAGSTAGVGGQINGFVANGGSASMTFAGIPGYTYNVQRSTDMSNWTTIWTTNAPTGGLFDFTDGSAPQPDAFYRLMWNGN